MAWFRCGGGGITSDEVTATKANVLAGKRTLTNDSNDEVATGELPLSSVLVGNGGTMPNNGSQSATLGFGGSKTIPAGYTSGGTVNVSITDRRGWYGGVGVGGTTYIPEGYHNGNGYVYGPSDGNLVAGNIKNGVSIFGVWGNVRPYGYCNYSSISNLSAYTSVTWPVYWGSGAHTIYYFNQSNGYGFNPVMVYGVGVNSSTNASFMRNAGGGRRIAFSVANNAVAETDSPGGYMQNGSTDLCFGIYPTEGAWGVAGYY